MDSSHSGAASAAAPSPSSAVAPPNVEGNVSEFSQTVDVKTDSSPHSSASLPPPSPRPPPPPAFTPSPSPPPQTASTSAAAHSVSSALKRSPRSPSAIDATRSPSDLHRSDSAASNTPSAIDDESALDPYDEASSIFATTPSARKQKLKVQPQLIEHLPLAEDAAMATFQEITYNDYHDKKLGRPPGKFDDYMICDCSTNSENQDLACTDYSGCINRMTQIECSASKCRWGKLCHNQRFHRRQYANVDIVQTEKKGFGLRACQDIPKETFVYEYVGEVMNQPTFLDRMQQYRVEGIRHFYFMMLQPNEYLDATKKGGKGRFINHSCNPNCSVSKWQVGKHLRMGIFAKRDIQKGEELTFNYNVDRYGNDAQECFCGEPNCVGTLGGKTQTDLSGMDDLFLDALGISDEVEQTEAKGSRRKRGKRLDLDFIPQMRPIQEHEATRVMTAARQAGPKREILEKLLRRMEMTTDVNVQKSLVKLHGFILMQFLLEQWWNDRDIVLLIVNVLARWPLIARNKVIDCGVEDQIRIVADTYRPKAEIFEEDRKPSLEIKSEIKAELTDADNNGDADPGSAPAPVLIGAPPAADAEVSSRAEHLLGAWKKLDMTYRIARKDAIDGEDTKDAAAVTTWVDRRRLQDLEDALDLDLAQAPNAVSSELGSALSGDQDLRESQPTWQPPPAPPSMANNAAAKRLNGFGHPRASPGSFTPSRLQSSGQSPLTPDQVASALSSSLAKSLPGLVSSLKQQGIQLSQQQQQQQQQPTPQPAAPQAKSIEDIIREANEQEERARKEAEAAAKAARELELNGGHTSSASRKRPSSSSRHPDKRVKHSSSSSSSHSNPKHNSTSVSTAVSSVDANAGAAELAASNERRLRKLVGEIVVRQMSKHKDELERESFKRHAKELTNVIVGKEMRNPKSWPPARGATLTDLASDKKAKVKAFAKEYIDKLLARKGKGKGSTTPSNNNDGVSSSVNGSV
ncbi:histone-lysine N-methyltransferase [Pseudozyma hubeiensis SY62]|uniref:Histone-lysine N-methyltransferase, H3 lysine-36 specific n=1 Tax=Pseudozyma hubeiensis (strain SY62) TaxID=1305764 RepID=R9PAT7_PSEHS|nr:histone-lysine N-methyltransferase [Pseudozyma hubeiensis SY62]GAC98518.1 histone-lysine N-methyltransferase [Pseudozyma hubeiensis SY62]